MKFVSCFSFIFFLFSSTILNSQSLKRGPYLTLNTPNSIHLHWYTSLPTSTKVHYGLSDANLNFSISDTQLVIHHDVLIPFLNPGTKYFYSIGNSLLTFQHGALNYFITAPLTSKTYKKTIRFWAVGDVAKQTFNQINVRNAFSNYVDSLQVDGWIMLGDNAYENGFDSEYESGFFNYYQADITKHIPLWPCLGNHDYANDYTARTLHGIAYFDLFSLPKQGEAGGVASNTERYYSFDYGNVHFVNLDSYGLENVNGTYYSLADTLLSPQVNWLKQDLTHNTLPWIIVSFHHPPYCLGTHNSDTETDLIGLRTSLIPILERYNVDLVLNGHSHSYERSGYLKNHYGLESSFDAILHARQSSTGKNDGSLNSCAYYKSKYLVNASDSGTVFAVVGSGGAIPKLPFSAWPHNAMMYSNYEDNGSLLITIEDNQLDAVWLSTDVNQIIKDQFSIIKQVNKIDTIYVNYPSNVQLTANWKSSVYDWSTGDSAKQISVFVNHDTTITVYDEWHCIYNQFKIYDANALLNHAILKEQMSKVYPNPFEGELTIELPFEGSIAVKLMNVNGQLVWKHQEENFKKKKTIIIDNPLIKGGWYFLRIDTENGDAYHQAIFKN